MCEDSEGRKHHLNTVGVFYLLKTSTEHGAEVRKVAVSMKLCAV